jgi:hypothetical protein
MYICGSSRSIAVIIWYIINRLDWMAYIYTRVQICQISFGTQWYDVHSHYIHMHIHVMMTSL